MRCQINPAFWQRRRQRGNGVSERHENSKQKRGGDEEGRHAHGYTRVRTRVQARSLPPQPPRSCGAFQRQRAACEHGADEINLGGELSSAPFPRAGAPTAETRGFPRVAGGGQRVADAKCLLPGERESHGCQRPPDGPGHADGCRCPPGSRVGTAPQKVPVLTALGGDFGLPNVLEDGVALLVFHSILVLLRAAALLGHPRGALDKNTRPRAAPRGVPNLHGAG